MPPPGTANGAGGRAGHRAQEQRRVRRRRAGTAQRHPGGVRRVDGDRHLRVGDGRPAPEPGGTLPTSTPAGVGDRGVDPPHPGPVAEHPDGVAGRRGGDRRAGSSGRCATGPAGRVTGVKVSAPSARHRQLGIVRCRVGGTRPTAGRAGRPPAGSRRCRCTCSGLSPRRWACPRASSTCACGAGPLGPLDQPLGGGRRHVPAASGLAGQPEHARADEVRGLGGEDRIGLRLARGADRAQDADAGEASPGVPSSSSVGLRRCRPRPRRLRRVVRRLGATPVHPEAAGGEGLDGDMRGAVGSAGRQPPMARHDACAPSSVYQMPPVGRRRVGAPPVRWARPRRRGRGP